MTNPIRVTRPQARAYQRNLTKPVKHRLKRTVFEPRKPTRHIAKCGFVVVGEWESRAVRSAITISGKVTCADCKIGVEK